MSVNEMLMAAAGTGGGDKLYVDDVFSTYLFAGNSSTQTITNNIDLDGEGGLVWLKGRNNADDHVLFDTARGVAGGRLYSNKTNAQDVSYADFDSFNSNGFTLGFNPDGGYVNTSGTNYCSWTFREQAKFFDVVTYTGNGTAGRTVAHTLGSTPGMIIVKKTSSTGNWIVYHRSTGATKYLYLNSTSDAGEFSGFWNDTAPTSTEFTVGTHGDVNASGATYVAYLFAHDAGGFGAAGTDNVISCGTFTTATSTLDVTLGYEPQYIMYKRTDAVGVWQVYDNMRGFPNGRRLAPNSSATEDAGSVIQALATGFNVNTTYNATFIYMAIRRPMKVPTTGTQVFSPIVSSATTGTVLTTGFPIDLQIAKYRNSADSNYVMDRMRGVNTTGVTGMSSPFLETNTTSAEGASTNLNMTNGWNNTSFKLPAGFDSASSIYWNFRRASGFFDEVCYTGTGTSGQTYNHNLTVVPEMMIVKRRSSAEAWAVYTATTGNTKYLRLNDPQAVVTDSGRWNNTTPTSTVFTVGNDTEVNGSGSTYVAYLFATCPGVSKVGSYTGTGATQTINCGFTGGARFVLIKRTDASGDWYVWDTARGIVSGNDPYLLLNSSAAEMTLTDFVDPVSTGFELSSTALATVNVSGGSYIFFAVA